MGELTRQSPEQVVAPIHSKTMPVILTPDEGEVIRSLPVLYFLVGAPCWASTSEDFLAGLGKVILNCSALP
jgi:hypothetical protein